MVFIHLLESVVCESRDVFGMQKERMRSKVEKANKVSELRWINVEITHMDSLVHI